MAHIALIGAGIWGARILRDLLGLGATVTVVDTDPAARAAAVDRGVAAVATLADVGAVDGWVVATPATTHAALLHDLADRPGPVLCEKPLTVDVTEARQVVAALGDRLHVAHVWRYHPAIQRLGELARSGTLGEVHGVRSVRANWTSPRTDVDTVWNLAPHDVTIAIEVLGTVPTPRAALVEHLDGRAVSMWAHLGGAGAPWLVSDSSNRYGDKRREVRVHGSDAVAVLAADGEPIRLERGRDRDPVLESIDPGEGSALERLLAAWLGHVQGGPPPKSDAAEALTVIETVDRLRELAGLGTTA